jgi:hypothetical protein
MNVWDVRNDDDAIGNEHEHRIALLDLFLGIYTYFCVCKNQSTCLMST